MPHMVTRKDGFVAFLHLSINYIAVPTPFVWASPLENLSSGVSEQHRRRAAWASAQSDQRLCYSLFGKFHM